MLYPNVAPCQFTVYFLCEKSWETLVSQVSREKLCTQICQQACDWLKLLKLANHRPADKFFSTLDSLERPSASTFLTQKVDCELSGFSFFPSCWLRSSQMLLHQNPQFPTISFPLSRPMLTGTIKWTSTSSKRWWQRNSGTDILYLQHSTDDVKNECATISLYMTGS